MLATIHQYYSLASERIECRQREFIEKDAIDERKTDRSENGEK